MRQRLLDAGIDVDTGISRFMGNEGLFLKFLGKFLQDTNFAGLTEAINKKDCGEAFRYAHTLKGVCGNLSMDELYKLVSVQTESFRERNFQEGADMMEKISAVYGRIKEAIEETLLELRTAE